MMKWMLAAGAAALAISVPSAAQRGGDKGDRGQAAKVDRGGGGKAQAARAQRGGGGDHQVVRAQRGGGDRGQAARIQRGGGGDRARAARVERRGGDRVRATRVERQGGRSQAVRVERRGGNDRAMRFAAPQERARRIDRGEVRRAARIERPQRVEMRDNRGRERVVEQRIERGRADRDTFRGRERAIERRAANTLPQRAVIRGDGDRRFAVVDRNPDIFRVRDFDRRDGVRFRDVDRDDLFFRRLGYGAGGCPPGLAKKSVACMPPGQARKLIGQPLSTAARLAALDPLPSPFRSLYWDDDDYYYRYGGGYLYRVDRDDDLIDGLLPLFGAALLGQQLNPYYVNSYYQPPYYSAFYPNSPYDCYQYGYGYVYETDCASGLVEDVIPTYDYGYGVGQLMPASYSYYNLPYTYRSSFIDDDDYYYRYAPGSIYRVDRDTSLISAVVALLTNGLTVGQPLPMGYSAYNVPLAYRTSYYDTPDVWYRYDNGYIYAVDPGTRVVRNVAYAIV